MIPVGTRSLLYGSHCWLWHPLLVFIAWWRLYGFPLDLRLWVAFVVHDLGYWGKPNMDGEEGEAHVLLGAAIMLRLFGQQWADLCEFHSRHWSHTKGRNPSALCWADKYAVALLPPWLYVPPAWLSGEIHEYMAVAAERERRINGIKPMFARTYTGWFAAVREHLGSIALQNTATGGKE